MALLWCHDCGARHSTAQIQAGRGFDYVANHDGISVVEDVGRGGNTPVIRMPTCVYENSLTKVFSGTNIPEAYFFFRINMIGSSTDASVQDFFIVKNFAATAILQLRTDALSKSVKLCREGTVLGSIFVLSTRQQVVELRLKPLGSSSGIIQVHVDGVEVYSATNLTFSNTDGVASAWFSGSRYNSIQWQDLMIFDPNGNAPNTWLGPTAFLQTQFPTGDGNTHAWTLSAGSDHYAVVDETPANDETDYAYSETEGQIEQYTFPDLPAQVSSVVAAALVVQGQPYGEGSSFSIQPSVRVSSTDYLPVSAQDGPSSFNDTQFIIDEDPSTAAAWTISGLNGAQLGLKHVSSS